MSRVKLTKQSNTLLIFVGLAILVLIGWWLLMNSKPVETQVKGNGQDRGKLLEVRQKPGQAAVVESMQTGVKDESADKNGDGVVDISDL